MVGVHLSKALAKKSFVLAPSIIWLALSTPGSTLSGSRWTLYDASLIMFGRALVGAGNRRRPFRTIYMMRFYVAVDSSFILQLYAENQASCKDE